MLKRILDRAFTAGMCLMGVGYLLAVATPWQALAAAMLVVGVMGFFGALFIGRITATEDYEGPPLGPPIALLLAFGTLLSGSLAAADPGILPAADPHAPQGNTCFILAVFIGTTVVLGAFGYLMERLTLFHARQGAAPSPTKPAE